MISGTNKSSYWGETWVKIKIDVEGVEKIPHYEVSNFGRLRSFQDDKDLGKIIKGSVIQGYKSLNIRFFKGKTFNRYVHKLVAEYFVKKESEEHSFVIHLDFDKQNNRFENLKWVTKAEMYEHNRKNPAVLNKPIPKRTKNYKLTESKVKIIKKLLRNGNSRLKMIAQQFGITHTQLNRIRSGENWGHVTIDD